MLEPLNPIAQDALFSYRFENILLRDPLTYVSKNVTRLIM